MTRIYFSPRRPPCRGAGNTRQLSPRSASVSRWRSSRYGFRYPRADFRRRVDFALHRHDKERNRIFSPPPCAHRHHAFYRAVRPAIRAAFGGDFPSAFFRHQTTEMWPVSTAIASISSVTAISVIPYAYASTAPRTSRRVGRGH